MKGINAKEFLLIIVFFVIISVNIYKINEDCAKSKRKSVEKYFAEKLKTTTTTTTTTTTKATSTTMELNIEPSCEALINVSNKRKFLLKSIILIFLENLIEIIRSFNSKFNNNNVNIFMNSSAFNDKI